MNGSCVSKKWNTGGKKWGNHISDLSTNTINIISKNSKQKKKNLSPLLFQLFIWQSTCVIWLLHVHTQFYSLRRMSLNSDHKSFLQASPPKKIFNHQQQKKKTLSTRLISFLSPSLCLPSSNQPLLPPHKQQIWKRPPFSFLSLQRHTRAMWSLQRVTAQRRPASGCGEQRDRRLTNRLAGWLAGSLELSQVGIRLIH